MTQQVRIRAQVTGPQYTCDMHDRLIVDRVAGVALGGAVGDALGAGYEFQDRPGPHIDMIGGGPFGVAPGEWTDDTAMANAILRVVATGTVDLEAIGAGFLEWHGGRPKDVGNQTRAVLGPGAQRGAAALTELAATHFADNPRASAGNGSLMRTGPVVLAHLGDDDAIARSARAISDLTHADPLAGDACVLWCIAIDRAVREQRLDGIDDGLALLPAERRSHWRDLLHAARTDAPASFTPNGFVVSALQAALSAIHHTPIPTDEPARHLRDALVAAVRIGNDTDTVAAIAGALLGARWGSSAVPLRWRAMLHGWPGWTAEDVVRHAILAGNGGRPDPHGWPSTPSMLAHYASDWPATPVLVTLPDDPGVLLANAPGMMEATGVDQVVSLCRMGTVDVPGGARAHQLHLIDAPGANPNLRLQLRDLAETVAHWRDDGRTVVIHCVRAESRTPTAATAYLAHRLGITATDALAQVRAVLPNARPNRDFARTLQEIWG